MEQQPVMPVPGSEVFSSRLIPFDELKANISPTLKLHEVTDADIDSIDPLTYEVVRHRIWSITDEMGETLKRMSGSISVTEANDFDFAVCDELGQAAQVGLYNTMLVASMDLAVYWTLQHRSGNPGIEPGDMFLTNDPWVGGGLHQNDTAIMAPLFHDGKLFGWTSAVCHMADVGGAKPGSSDLAASDAFSEGAPTPPIKIVRGGVLQDDVVDAFIRRSRMPLLVNLDVRAEIGANQAGHARLHRLIDRYGPTVVKAVMKRMMNDSEQRLRTRLRDIPDGSWKSVGYLEQSAVGDRGMHKIALEMTKTGDHLTFDFRGTDPQAGMVNCPWSGMRAGISVALMPILAGDIPWSAGGLVRCFDIISDEGTINNATFPASVGWAPLTAAWATSNLVADCFAKMLDAAPEEQSRVQCGCTGSFEMVTMAGIDQRGAPTVMMLLDMMAGGYGARPDADGQDTAGILPIPMGRAPDAEMQEFIYPLLFLWRREEIDSGGAGTARGGLSISICVVPHGTPAPLSAAFSGNGKARPEATGQAGGYPGGTAFDLIVRGSNVQELFSAGKIPGSLEELGDRREVVGNRKETLIGLDDAVFVHPSGGGGYGDPLLRSPDKVARDVGDGKVSAAAARTLYGVALDTDNRADPVATASLRAEERRRRIGGDVSAEVTERHSSGSDLNVNVAVHTTDSGDVVVCKHCGHEIGTASAEPLEGLTLREGPITEAGPGVLGQATDYVDQALIFHQLSCPRCATAMHTSVVVSG
ncbi:hydantoinase B/oxoprolinase family protein [Mycobacterium sp.]|uniref:hydantoinase B/oxoprolinase family protein n=1 Tax=Mycobacterium sp. TaxID=1785 RepID=UPI002D99F324|nr:hydantoinase B/oxoprolinase family protein [Mycobacterium sp.]